MDSSLSPIGTHTSLKPTETHAVENPPKGLNHCERFLWERTWKLRTKRGYFQAKEYVKYIYIPLLKGKLHIIDSFSGLSQDSKQEFVNLATGCRPDTSEAMFTKYKNMYLKTHPEEELRSTESVKRDKKRGRPKAADKADQEEESEETRREKKPKSESEKKK
jgi:hypothetical protein